MRILPETGFIGVLSKQTRLLGVGKEVGVRSHIAILPGPLVWVTSYPNTVHFASQVELTLFLVQTL